jgi:hypothetical protein
MDMIERWRCNSGEEGGFATHLYERVSLSCELLDDH